MTFQQDVLDLKKHLDEIHSIEEMRSNLLKRDLRLTVSIYTSGVQCLEWDIIDKKCAGIVELGFYIKLAKLSADNISVANTALYKVTFDQKSWTNQEELFEKLTQSIKNSIKAMRI